MDCQTARQMIDMHPKGVSGWRSVDGEAVRDHLAGCSLCQSVASEIIEWDQRVGALMTAVDVPDGVRERLVAQLTQAAAPQGAGPPVARPAQKRSLRRVLAGISLCAALVSGIVFWMIRPTQFDLRTVGDSAVAKLRPAQLAAKVPGLDGVTGFDGSFAVQIADPQWQKVCSQPPVGWDLDGRPGHDVAAYLVNIPSRRFRGWLVLVPITRISDVPPSLDPATISYGQMAAWHDTKYVFVFIAAEPGSIEKFVEQWNGNAA